MEEQESNAPLATVSASGSDVPVPVASPAKRAASSLAPRPCPTCGVVPAANGGAAAIPSYVYAIGRIEPRFPRPSVEKEFAQATGRAETAGLTDRRASPNVLSPISHRH